MAWSTPRTWVANELVTAAIMNLHVRDNLNILKTSINDDGTINISNSIVQARLTLTTNTPVTTSDVTSATTLYLTPYDGYGDRVLVYTGSTWSLETLSELSITNGGLAADTLYDVFLDYNAGSLQLVLVAWTNDTTRATGLALQDNIYVRTSNTDHLYVGTVRTDGASQFSDSLAKRYVWNAYNRVWRPMQVREVTDSWTYSSTTFQQANASAGNQLDYVVGLETEIVEAAVVADMSHSSASGLGVVAVGVDSTTIPSGVYAVGGGNSGGARENLTAKYLGYPGVGRHTLKWIEGGNGTVTATWYGDDALTVMVTGIMGSVWA